MDPLTWTLLGGLGAWAALDATAAGQFMIGRPLVTGTLAGALVGHVETGFLVGALLEVAHLGAVPVGGARIPDPGPAAIPAVVLAVAEGSGAGIVGALALGLALGAVGGGTIILQRRLNGRLVEGAEDEGFTAGVLGRRLLLALAADGARGAGLTLAGTAAALAVAPVLGAAWPLDDVASRTLALVLCAYPAGVAARQLNAGRARSALLLAGAATGLVLGLWVLAA